MNGAKEKILDACATAKAKGYTVTDTGLFFSVVNKTCCPMAALVIAAMGDEQMDYWSGAKLAFMQAQAQLGWSKAQTWSFICGFDATHEHTDKSLADRLTPDGEATIEIPYYRLGVEVRKALGLEVRS